MDQITFTAANRTRMATSWQYLADDFLPYNNKFAQALSQCATAIDTQTNITAIKAALTAINAALDNPATREHAAHPTWRIAEWLDHCENTPHSRATHYAIAARIIQTTGIAERLKEEAKTHLLEQGLPMLTNGGIEAETVSALLPTLYTQNHFSADETIILKHQLESCPPPSLQFINNRPKTKFKQRPSPHHRSP